MTIPLITTIPSDPPSTDDPATFDGRADNFLGDFPAFGSELNASITAMNADLTQANEDITSIAASAAVAADAAGLLGRMTGTLTVGPGAKAITLLSPKPSLAVATRQVVILLLSDPTIRMFGTIASSPTPTSSAFSVTVVSGGVSGSGSYSEWQIMDAAFLGAAATVAQIRAGDSDAVGITPKGLRDSNAPVTLAYASTVTPDLTADGWHRRMTASASFTLGAPTNCKPGDVLVIDGTNSAGSVVLAVNAVLQRSSLGVIGPGSGARWKIFVFIDEVDGSGTCTRGSYNVQRVSG